MTNITQKSRVDLYVKKYLPRLETPLRRYLPDHIVNVAAEFLVFGIKQAWACLFGGLLLGAILATTLYWPEDFFLHRYDGLLIFAIGMQVAFLASGLERLAEAKTILIFHLVGTLMEVFKTSMGSWHYPEAAIIRIGDVPLFSGFMYAAVGSYLARATRVFDLKFNHYPPLAATLLIGLIIYINFYSHHYLYDIRYFLFAATCILWGRSWVHFRVHRWGHKIPLIVGFVLISLFIWLAENIATFGNIWLYPNQSDGWTIVSLSKLGAWYLLMIVSFVLVTLTHPPKPATPIATK